MSSPEPSEHPADVPAATREPIVVIDLAVGASVLALTSVRAVGRRMHRIAKPVAGVVLRPPMVPARYQLDTLLVAMARQGHSHRPDLVRQVSAALDVIVPSAVAATLARVDVAEIVRESTSSVASDTVQGVRMQGISGDEAVGRAVGRLRRPFSRKDAVVPEP
ncbi:hypothetical protein ACQPXM_24210 [Kribbella sp. CA-253562]|uniref:hypothetical protein n=1 Tax=Kribbella sp. CA-253562 TaxID=3239942 RepID=UPI003D8D01BB